MGSEAEEAPEEAPGRSHLMDHQRLGPLMEMLLLDLPEDLGLGELRVAPQTSVRENVRARWQT